MTSLETKNPYISFIPSDNSQRIYLVFSSVDIEKGKFMFWKILNRMDGHKIFINDESNGWYVHGIPGFGKDVMHTCHELMKKIDEVGAEEIILLGPSMGAYGAMLYGSILKNKMPNKKFRCLSFGGEFLLYARETQSKSLSRKPKNLWYADLRSLLITSELDITHVYGDDNVNDVFQANLVKGMPNIKLISIKNAPHAISTYLGQNYDLTVLIKEYEQSGDFKPEGVSLVSEISNHGIHLYNGHLAMLDGKVSDALTHLKKATELCPSHALSRHKYGAALLMSKQYDEALCEQIEAIKLNPQLAHAYYHAGILNSLKNENLIAIDYLKECINLDPKHIRAITQIMLIHEKLKNKELVIKYAEYALALDKKNEIALKTMASVNKNSSQSHTD